MSRILRKINYEEVKSVPQLVKPDNRPIKGSALFSELYANIFLCARKKSGKTSAIFKIIKECCGLNTTIIAFVSTLNKDANWLTIQKYCELKKIPFVGNTSMVVDGVNLLEEFVDQQQEEAQGPTEKEAKEKHLLFQDSDSEEEEKPKKKAKFRSPEYLIIFDDLSNELKNPALVSLLKKNRHFKSKIIVSSQYLNDLLPQSRKQIDIFMIFKGQPESKLDEIYRDADLAITKEEFYDLYKIATKENYSFLYVDRFNDTFRRNFNYEFQLN